ncbi:MAG TPA: N-formylglutamate amidohydrolase, partial [Ramlibacter sp.]
MVSMPHIGTEIPADLRERYVPRALDVEDADWHLHRLYDWLPALGA